MSSPQTIAIDGPAGSGKSTIGKLLAEDLDYLYFDTGVMYRAVTLAALQKFIDINNEEGISHLAEKMIIDVRPPTKQDGRLCDVLIDGKDVTWDIHSPEIDAQVSIVSAYRGVRQALSRQQRRIGLGGKVVMVGRDIGTVILPEADLKIYLDASKEERANRRYKERLQRGEKADFEMILSKIRERDRIDSSREIAPLKPAENAVLINTDGLSIQEVFDELMLLIETNDVK
jgi:cytidylate kinase